MPQLQKETPVFAVITAGNSQDFVNMKSVSIAAGSSGTATITILDESGNPTTDTFTLPNGISGNWEASGGFVFNTWRIAASGGTVYVTGTKS